MKTYTPGPWRKSALASSYIIAGDDPAPICSVGEYDEDGQSELLFVNAKANAELIIAAPELYEALERANTNIALAHEESALRTGCYGIAICDCPLAVNWRHSEAILKKARGER